MGYYNAPLDHLKSVIAAQGRRIDWLAKQCGVSSTYITLILDGDRRMQRPIAERMAASLGLPLDFVLGTPQPEEAIS